jgi:hypothetical protein
VAGLAATLRFHGKAQLFNPLAHPSTKPTMSATVEMKSRQRAKLRKLA